MLIYNLSKNICVFHVFQPYLGICSDPKHFIDKTAQKSVNYSNEMMRTSENT